MASTPPWISAGISAAAFGLNLLIFLGQRKKFRIEYFVVSSSLVVNDPTLSGLEITFGGQKVLDAASTTIRIACTGREEVAKDRYDGDWSVHLPGASQVIEAVSRRARPGDLAPNITYNGNRATISPLLLNSGDVMEVQFLTSGLPASVKVEGRVRGVTFKQRSYLPYRIGSGKEGKLVAQDRLAWFLLFPAMALALAELR